MVAAADKVERGQKVVKMVVLVAVQDEVVQLERAFLDKEIMVVLEILIIVKVAAEVVEVLVQ